MLSDVVSQSYSCTQTIGKAVEKVKRKLLASPQKQKAILAYIVSNMDEADKLDIVNVVNNSKHKRYSIPDQVNADIRSFFEGNVISVVRKHIRARDCDVSNAADFIKAFKMTAKQFLLKKSQVRIFNKSTMS